MTPAQITLTQWRGNVNRWHSNPVNALRNSGDTIHAHAARCCILLLRIKPDVDVNTLAACLHHDTAETITGDMPYLAKQRWPELRIEAFKAESRVDDELELRAYGHPLIKLVDRLDALLWAHDNAPFVIQETEWQECVKWLEKTSKALGCHDVVGDILDEAGL